MDFLQNLSDDQTALIGCFLALVASGALMTVSYYLGPQRKKAVQPATHRLPRRQDDQNRSGKAA